MRRAKDIKPQQDDEQAEAGHAESVDEDRRVERKTNALKSRCC